MPLKPLVCSYSLSARTYLPSQTVFLHSMALLLQLMIHSNSSTSLPHVYIIPALAEWKKLSSPFSSERCTLSSLEKPDSSVFLWILSNLISCLLILYADVCDTSVWQRTPLPCSRTNSPDLSIFSLTVPYSAAYEGESKQKLSTYSICSYVTIWVLWTVLGCYHAIKLIWDTPSFAFLYLLSFFTYHMDTAFTSHTSSLQQYEVSLNLFSDSS